MKTLLIAVCGVVILAFGCSKRHSSDAIALEGAWSAVDSDPMSLVIRGSNFEAQDATSNNWLKATFSLREDKDPKQLVLVLTQSSDPKEAGKTANAIYQIQGDTLTITANEPGDPDVPKGFDDTNSDKLVFKRK